MKCEEKRGQDRTRDIGGDVRLGERLCKEWREKVRVTSTGEIRTRERKYMCGRLTIPTL